MYNARREKVLFFLRSVSTRVSLVPVVSSAASAAAPGGGELEAGDALEVHHLQHLLGLAVNLDDVL